MPRSTKRLSEEEREQRRAEDRGRYEQSLQELLSSEGWQRWVRVRATNGLSRYSFGNQLLIALQFPEATYVAGFRAFLELGRCVRKGESAIRILAPMSVKDRLAIERGDEDAKRLVFRAVCVFDVSQTDPLPDVEPTPLHPPAEPISGDSHADLLEPLGRLAADLGYSVEFRSIEGSAEGWCDYEAKHIVVNSDTPANARVRVLVHEIAHALGLTYKDYGRERCEVLVDTATFIVCGSVGLDVSGESVPYVAGWGGEDALDAIREYAGAIDAVAGTIEDAITPKETAETEAAASAA